jgi:hypothetical protein
VFDAKRRPWILSSGASADTIANVIAKCPSGALHFTRHDGGLPETPQEPISVMPRPNASFYVRGLIQLKSSDGKVAEFAVWRVDTLSSEQRKHGVTKFHPALS